MSIAENLREIMPEALEHVSEGNMKFTVRQLFYAVLETYPHRYPNEPFYKDYDTFAQDFLTDYEKQNGKIKNMLHEPRGHYCIRSETEIEAVEVDETVIWGGVNKGVSDKILIVEKEGFFKMLIENEFPERFDINIISLKGFSTEAGRNILKILEESKFKLYVLHDYDVNGILIHETLTRPTKRRDVYVDDITDLGYSWSDIQDFLKNGTRPRPVKLKLQDASKLEGMLRRGDITPEEFDFLKHNRVELNTLKPLKFLEWLKNKFEKYDIHRIIPEEEELKTKTEQRLLNMTEERTKKLLKIEEIYDVYYYMSEEAIEFIKKNKEILETDVDLEEFKELMGNYETYYWKMVTREYARGIFESKDDAIIEELMDRGLKTVLQKHVKDLEKLLGELKDLIL